MISVFPDFFVRSCAKRVGWQMTSPRCSPLFLRLQFKGEHPRNLQTSDCVLMGGLLPTPQNAGKKTGWWWLFFSPSVFPIGTRQMWELPDECCQKSVQGNKSKKIGMNVSVMLLKAAVSPEELCKTVWKSIRTGCGKWKVTYTIGCRSGVSNLGNF